MKVEKILITWEQQDNKVKRQEKNGTTMVFDFTGALQPKEKLSVLFQRES